MSVVGQYYVSQTTHILWVEHNLTTNFLTIVNKTIAQGLTNNSVSADVSDQDAKDAVEADPEKNIPAKDAVPEDHSHSDDPNV